MTFTIPVTSDHIRTLKDPNRSQIRIVHALVQVSDLPRDIPLEPDPRVPKVKGPVIKKISESLRTNDGRFHLLNRGIAISARDTEFDSRRNVLKLVIPDNDSYGIIDGGHTYQAISQVIKEVGGSPSPNGGGIPDGGSTPLADQFVHLEVLVSIENDLADIAEARNYSVPLKAWTLAAYKEKFEWFLEAVGPDYRKYIKTSENDEQPVGILDLIQVMCAVNPNLFSRGAPAVEAYKNAGKCLEYFINDNDSWSFRKLESVCRDVVRLYDHVRYNWKKAYNAEDETGKKGRLGALSVTKQRKRNRVAMATYYFLDPKRGPIKGDVPVEKGFSIPVIASLRALLEEKNEKYRWYTNPFDFFDEHGSRLVKVVMAANDSIGDNPHVVGRDPQVYTALYSEVRRWYLEGKLARLESKAPGQ
jgi:hypothetical protein